MLMLAYNKVTFIYIQKMSGIPIVAHVNR